MQAIVYPAYGPPSVLRCEDVAKPAPAPGEVLIQVRAASVNPLDWHFMRGTPYFIRLMLGPSRPRDPRLGVDVAGIVEAAGSAVTRFQPGDAVFGTCRGAFAEYACAPEKNLARKPDRLSFEQAAAVPIAGLTALQAFRDKGKLQPAQRVLVNGAAGGVGTFAVQIARSFGAEVTAVCGTRNVELVRSLGAARVLDYTRDDFTRDGARYHVILDLVGNRSLVDFRRLLLPGGVYVGAAGSPDPWMIGGMLRIFAAPLLSFGSRKLTGILARPNYQDLEALARLFEDGAVTPVIDRCYPLTKLPEAIAYLEEGHARGKVVIVPS